MAGTCAILSLMSVGALAKGLMSITILGLIVMGLISVTKHAKAVQMGVLITLAATIAVLAVAVGVLSTLDQSKLAGATACISILSIIFGGLIVISKNAAGSIATMIVMAGVIAILSIILYNLASLPIEQALGASASLSILLLSLAAFIGIIATITPIMVQAFAGVGMFGALVAELAIVLAALGDLYRMPGLSDLINDGGQLLYSIGNALGGFVGGIAAGIAEGISSVLPQLGSDLSTFMANAALFINGLKNIDSRVLDSAKCLAQTVLMICGAELLNTITSFISGDSDMASFGEKLASFGESIITFSNMLTQNGGINEEAIKSAANAGKLMSEMAKAIPNSGGVAGFFAGNNDIDDFGKKLVKFGKYIVKFSNKLTENGGINEEAVESAYHSGMMMSKLAESIPNSGGVLGFLDGNNDIDKFGKKLVGFGKYIVEFSNKLTENGGINTKAILSAAAAGGVMSVLQKSIPKSGGIKSLWSGKNDLSTFGKNLNKFGEAIVDFSTTVKDIDTGSINSAVSACRTIINLSEELSEESLGNLGTLSSSMKKLGKDSIDKFITAFKDKKDDIINTGKTVISKVLDGIKSKHNDFKNNGMTTIIRFSDGLRLCQASVIHVFQSSLSAALYKVRSYYQGFYSAGSYLGSGLSNGLESKRSSVTSTARSLGKAANDAFTKEEDIHSPSKIWYKYGNYMVKGLTNALDNGILNVTSTTRELAGKSNKAFSEVISKVSNLLNDDIDMNPTISPVIDLSNVEDGARRINSMMRINPSIRTLAEVGSINTIMKENQNGMNRDIISAIGDLKDSLGNISGNTYHINGITYDDGSNIANAVESIVKAARIGRRV